MTFQAIEKLLEMAGGPAGALLVLGVGAWLFWAALERQKREHAAALDKAMAALSARYEAELRNSDARHDHEIRTLSARYEQEIEALRADVASLRKEKRNEAAAYARDLKEGFQALARAMSSLQTRKDSSLRPPAGAQDPTPPMTPTAIARRV